MIEDSQEFSDWVREILHSDQAEIDKLREYFGQITSRIIQYARQEIDLAGAMQDRDELVKQQIKMETFRTAREIFARGYQIATGRKAWDGQDRG
jgi:hypothetical protein